jgi:hypothetical protein
MAATLDTTLTIPQVQPNYAASIGPTVRKYVLDWVSHTDGTVNLPTDIPVVGEILRVVFDPGGVAPTDDYDLVLNDEHGIDVLAGQGANHDTANSEHVCPGVPLKDGTTVSVRPVAVAGLLTLVITNAGSGKAGSVILYVR